MVNQWKGGRDAVTVAALRKNAAVKNEINYWEWLRITGPTTAQSVWSEHENFRNQLSTSAQNWEVYARHTPQIDGVLKNISAIFEQFYKSPKIFHSNSPEAKFVFQLRTEQGDVVAAGAYAGLLHAPMNLSSPMRADFVRGLFEAFLYSKEVDWVASAHREVLNRLKDQYTENISI